MPTNQSNDLTSNPGFKPAAFGDNTPKSQPAMTFGEKLVGLTFNPSNDDKVATAKRLCAELMDLVNYERQNRETTQLETILYNHTVGEILNAQMNVVKLLTLKY